MLQTSPKSGGSDAKPIFGIPVRAFGWPEALAFAEDAATAPGGQTVISFLNANNANIAAGNPAFRAVLNDHVVLPDGVGIDIAAHILYGSPFPANLNGTDFIPAFLTTVQRPLRIALIGARPEVLEEAVEAFRTHAPWHTILPVSDGYFEHEACGPVLDRLDAAKADVLLVALGVPAQEMWVSRHIRPDHARLVLCVGALFDLFTGRVPRAPERMRRWRIEWLFRLWCEPSRLWRRYVVGNPVFLYHVLGDKVKMMAKRSPRGII